MLVLSGLAIIVAAGDSIALHHQRILGFAWAGLLLVPALLVPVAIILLPWATGTDSESGAAGRRYGPLLCRKLSNAGPATRLLIVSGDARTAALVALVGTKPAKCVFCYRTVNLAVGDGSGHP